MRIGHNLYAYPVAADETTSVMEIRVRQGNVEKRLHWIVLDRLTGATAVLKTENGWRKRMERQAVANRKTVPEKTKCRICRNQLGRCPVHLSDDDTQTVRGWINDR